MLGNFLYLPYYFLCDVILTLQISKEKEEFSLPKIKQLINSISRNQTQVCQTPKVILQQNSNVKEVILKSH